MSHAAPRSARNATRRAGALALIPRAAALLGALAGLAAPALACPYCSLSQGKDTLLYIGGFVLLPYFVGSGIVAWIRHILASEHRP